MVEGRARLQHDGQVSPHGGRLSRSREAGALGRPCVDGHVSATSRAASSR